MKGTKTNLDKLNSFYTCLGFAIAMILEMKVNNKLGVKFSSYPIQNPLSRLQFKMSNTRLEKKLLL